MVEEIRVDRGWVGGVGCGVTTDDGVTGGGLNGGGDTATICCGLR